MELKIIEPKELHDLIKSGEEIQLIDLRENYELEIEGKSNAIHIPMGELVMRIDELKENIKVVFHCSSGNRSMNMMKFLIMNDLYKNNFYHLEGGYKEWSRFI